MPKLIDITGLRFGRLVALKYLGTGVWECACDCGVIVNVRGSVLNSRHTKSCGCARVIAGRARIKHGHNRVGARTKAYRAWANMLTRCNNPKNDRFQDWGGRGIKVCERWHTFENFLADMGEPLEGLTLDRINNNGNYEPSNCRWVTHTTQRHNRRDTEK